MKLDSASIRLSATDLSNHLACRHLTSLDLSVAYGKHSLPEWSAPDLAVIQELGLRHEAAYLNFLQTSGISVEDLREIKDEREAVSQTLACMERGVGAIAQGSLAAGRWFGRPDVIQKVPKPSRLGEWSYEAYDCKLARETKAATILQLAVYSTLLEENQGTPPEFMHVVPARRGFKPETYRIAEYAAYYRNVRARLEAICETQSEQTYAEPCVHCEICRWFRECDAVRRRDDHLSLVAGITRLQRQQLNLWQIETMAEISGLPVPLDKKPMRGAKEAYERTIKQARIQVRGRKEGRPISELLPVEDGLGFCRLPEPSPGDIFLDIEGDPFVGDIGRQYLFGFISVADNGEWIYQRKWSLTTEEEKSAFEWIVDKIMRQWTAVPNMHVYHFGAYEPSELKRLMGRYATKEDEIDRMLRAQLFADLHTILKQSARASVEQYGLKELETLYGFQRKSPLAESRAAMRYVEHWLELEWDEELPRTVRETLESYNEDDCRSALSMRNWLETERTNLEQGGGSVPRPPIADGAPSETLEEWQQAVAALVGQLTRDIPTDLALHSPEQHARWLLAQLLDWHRREDKATCWRYFSLAAMDDDDLLDERSALAGLVLAKRTPRPRGLPVDTYSFPSQDTDVRAGDKVCHRRLNIGEVKSIDLATRMVDVRKTKACLDIHPQSLFVDERGPNPKVLAESLFRVGEWVRDNGLASAGSFQAIRDLLLRTSPRLLGNQTISPRPGENAGETASRVVSALDNSVYAIQGPPGAGKTYTAAMIICKLASQGKKIGIAAFSHKAIRKVLETVQELAKEDNIEVFCVQKVRDEEEEDELDHVEKTVKNEVPLARLRAGKVRVAAGTVWLWARPEYFESVDVLVIDEAGQMSLANVVAAAQAAKNLVLIGDPQQLDQPLQGCHPPGAEKSVLEHLLSEHKTIPESMGLLIPETRRLHPKICSFTSEIFYEGKLHPHQVTKNRVLEGHPFLTGAGLWFVPVSHQGNRNACREEVAVVAELVEGILRPEVTWFYSLGNSRPLTIEDILIVAPYNAQVSDLLGRLPPGARVGTVDKFQGQDAPVVIYSLTTSSPEDAPRGMEFLYSLNRLNVATSRGMTNVIVIGSPRLFEPECRTPRQIQLANALCRLAEMAERKCL